MKAIRVHATGGPEQLVLDEVPRPVPAEGQALVRVEAAGVNYIDVYHRTGLYPQPLPFTPGSEAAGVVEEVGPGVTAVRPGDRVAYVMVPGAYAEYAVVPAEKLVPLPDGIDARTAAAAMLQGMTAQYLVASTYDLQPGRTALVHAAAGGVGGLLVQLCRIRGARVFATVSTAKRELVPEGPDAVIDYTTHDFEPEVMRLTNGAGVDVVYDSVGRTTFERSLRCVGLRGLLALYGQSSGPVAPVDPALLAKRGIYLTRPSLGHYTATRKELLWRARELFELLADRRLTLRIDRELPLSEAARAHERLESRESAGKMLLIP
jgi:NADPH:quinone reductase